MSSPDSDPPETPSDSESRWELIRDLLIFQLKLAIDAFRDVILVPVSLVAGAVDLATGNDRQSANFYEVVRLGRRSERWINLFGAVEGPAEDPSQDPEPTLDSLVGQVERLVVEQAEHGGVTASAKDAIDRSLDRITEVTQRNRASDDEQNTVSSRPEEPS